MPPSRGSRLRAVMTRRLLMVLALGAALALAGCGNKVETRTLAETEGLYLDVGDLKYQVQISRIINQYDIEDRSYLRGLPSGTLPPKADEAWFGVWLRVQNTTSDNDVRDRRGLRDRRHAGEHVRADRLRLRGQRLRLQRRGRSAPTRSCRMSSRPPARGRSRARCCCSSSPTRRCRTAPSSSRSRARRIPKTSGSSTSTSSPVSAAWMTVLAAGAAVSPPAPWPTSSTATATRGFA